MTTFFIWWHRRRAAHHAALKVNGGNRTRIWNDDYVSLSFWHASYEQWHLQQIERLQKAKLRAEILADGE